MVPYQILYAFPAIFACLNRLRGTGGIPVIKNGGPIAAVVFGLLIYLLTLNPILGVATAVAYFVGEMFGWGKWIGAITLFSSSQEDYNNSDIKQRKTGKDNGIHFLANLIFKETKHFKGYTILALFLRGLYWWIPVYLVFVFFGFVLPFNAAIATVAMAATFPLSFIIAYKVNKDQYWQYGEWIYGLCQGTILMLSILY